MSQSWYLPNVYCATPDEDDRWRVTVGGEILRWAIPTGFEHDYLSVPKLGRRVVSRNGRAGPAGIMHDYLYRHATALGLTRKQCDDAFLEAMEILQVPWYERQVAHKMVRACGWLPFNKHRKAEKNA